MMGQMFLLQISGKNFLYTALSHRHLTLRFYYNLHTMCILIFINLLFIFYLQIYRTRPTYWGWLFDLHSRWTADNFYEFYHHCFQIVILALFIPRNQRLIKWKISVGNSRVKNSQKLAAMRLDINTAAKSYDF